MSITGGSHASSTGMRQLICSTLLPAAGFPSIPVKKSPMVEQAVQTGPMENMTQKKLQPAKGPPVSQRGNRQGQTVGQPAPVNGNRRARNRSRGQNRQTTVKENAIKFDGDFDFESANAQFNREELDKEFKDKLNFKDDKTDKEGDEKGDSGVETQNSDGNPEEDPLGPNIYYDRTKSFFDNISSEMKSRDPAYLQMKRIPGPCTRLRRFLWERQGLRYQKQRRGSPCLQPPPSSGQTSTVRVRSP
ncbi:unnamed protein product [Ranitomeya imitator]|uniref:Uncharacterized protein n=1 Tax=Ranitomeya imitator TaxID=111125 RepID=A0ABN9LPC9_9NEOB|nr:unnamed protein product [Ranitomeya imitator]